MKNILKKISKYCMYVILYLYGLFCAGILVGIIVALIADRSEPKNQSNEWCLKGLTSQICIQKIDFYPKSNEVIVKTE